MSDISNKIKSIEPEDDVAVRALGLHPADDAPEIREKSDETSDPLPAFISNPALSADKSISLEPSFGARVFPVLAGAVWIIGALMLIHIFFNLRQAGQALSPAELTALAFLIIGPACLLMVTVFAMQRLSQLSRISAYLGRTTEKLMTPDESVTRRSKDIARAIQQDLEDLNAKIDTSIKRVSTLGQTVSEHAEKLDASGQVTEEKTNLIAGRLSQERDALASIADTFDARMSSLSTALDEHTEKLKASTQLAEQKIHEARKSVEGAAEKINTASDVVRSNTVEAAQTLESNHSELIALGDAIRSRAEDLDQLFSKHTSDLKGMISDLRNEQESLTTSLEGQLTKMRDMALSAQVSAEKLTDASDAGKQTVESLASAAQLTESAVRKRFSEMEDMVRYSTTKAENISEKAARRVQQSLSHTRDEISRIEADMIALQERLQQTPAHDLAELDPDLDSIPSSETDKDHEADSEIPIVPLRSSRPAETSEIATADKVEEPKLSDIEISELIADEAEEYFEIPDPGNFEEAEAVDTPDNLDIDIEEPDIEPEPIIDPEEDVREGKGDILRRTIPDIREPRRDSETRKPWWKSILSRDSASETTAIDRITEVARPSSTHEGDVIMTLAELGLSPGAIIDDGCIIEATDTRVTNGPNAMSALVAKRIGDPIEHLRRSVNDNAELKAKLSDFAARFHNSIQPIEDEAELLKSRFQKDDGRAFLICDAALNT